MTVLHQYEISPFCAKARRALHVKGVPFEVREVPPSRAFLVLRRLSPAGKVPVLEHDGHTVADSTEIVRYLEQCFPDPPLVPADLRDRALCHVLEDWADESLYFYEMTMRLVWPTNSKRWAAASARHDIAALRAVAPWVVPRVLGGRVRAQGVGRKPHDAVLADVERHAEALAALLDGREWLVGDALSIADIAVAVQVRCILDAQEAPAIFARHATVGEWLSRVDVTTGT